MVEPGGTAIVSSGGIARYGTLSTFSLEIVGSGGVASDTVLSGGSVLVSGGTTIDDNGVGDGTLGGPETVVSGGTAIGYTINVGDDGSLIISTGGVASNADINNYVTVAGGSTFNTTLGGGSAIPFTNVFGKEIVTSGGTTISTTVISGVDTISAGGTAIDASIDSGSTQQAIGGTSIGTTVFSFGSELVQSSYFHDFQPASLGTAISTTVAAFASEFVSSGGVTIGTTVLSAGTATVSVEGLASDTTLSGGTESVLSGGTAIGTVVSSGGAETVGSGGTDISATVSGGGSAIIGSGGLALSTTVASGGFALISSSIERYTVVSGGGTALLSGDDGVASGSTLLGGTEIVTSGDLSLGAKVESQGYQAVSSGGLTRQTVISGGTEAVVSGGTTLRTTVSAGTETVGGLASNTIIAGGTLDLLSGGTATGSILFAGSGLLAIQGTTLPGTTISSFAASDGIDLAGVVYTGSGTTAFDSTTGVLTVNEGGSSYQLTLAGDYASDTFALGPDSGSGTLVTLETVPCFAAGTLILTDRGEVPIEQLAIGDHVMTHEGEAAPILWIGHRRIACDRHAAPAKVWPVRIGAHAFGPGAPHRDLLLSPDHAILAEGVLIPVKHLIDGRSIRQLRRREVTYFHIRLARHTAILANGLPAESYLDTGDIGGFANAPGAVALHPAFGSERADITLVMEALGWAPLRVTGPEVEAVRTRLAKASELAGCFQLSREGSE